MKSFKKGIAIIMVLTLVLAMFAACKADTTTPPAESAPAVDSSVEPAVAADPEAPAGDVKIVLVTMDRMDQHWVALHDGALAKAAELGVALTWMAPDAKNDAEQIEKINDAVASGANAILVAANGKDSVTAALKAAADAGVKVVYVDSPANFPAYTTLGTDNNAAGVTAGGELKKSLEAAGVTEGALGIVSVNAATDSTVQREAGFRSVFEGTSFTIMETQYSEGDPVLSQEFASTFITQGVVGLYGTNEGTTVGVGNAIKEAGDTGILGVGFDKSDVALDLIEGGFLIGVMAQNPDVMGSEGVKVAVDAINGVAAASDYTDTGVSVITKENAASFR